MLPSSFSPSKSQAQTSRAAATSSKGAGEARTEGTLSCQLTAPRLSLGPERRGAGLRGCGAAGLRGGRRRRGGAGAGAGNRRSAEAEGAQQRGGCGGAARFFPASGWSCMSPGSPRRSRESIQVDLPGRRASLDEQREAARARLRRLGAERRTGTGALLLPPWVPIQGERGKR